MVLSRRWVMASVAAIAVVAGCRQSLFDAHGDTKDGGGSDTPSAATCPAPCLGDSGGDFDGTPNGVTGRWRYLEDHRDRTWTAMTAMDNGFVGANPANAIHSCTNNRNAEACLALPGALLISTAGSKTPADPAIEFTAETNQTIELQLGVHVPAGGFAQTVRIYRNSREDALVTATAEPNVAFSQMIRLDALAGDRFVVALVPPASGQPDIAVQLHVVGANATFPTECQLAIPFATLSSGTTEDACRSNNLTAAHDSSPGIPTSMLAPGPYPELGNAASIAQHNFYVGGKALDRPGNVTVDLWVKLGMLNPGSIAWIYSEWNEDSAGGGGVTISVNSKQSNLRLIAETVYTAPGTVNPEGVAVDYPADNQWHFLRVAHKADGPIRLCVDGVYKGMVAAPGALRPVVPPYIGQDADIPLGSSAFAGSIDDIRVLNTSLPCE